MTKKRLETPKDLENAKCLDCGAELVRFGDRSQINFKCTNRKCNSFFSDDKLDELEGNQMELDIKYGVKCATCTGEIDHEEGYSLLWVVVDFKKEVPDELDMFIYDRILDIGVDNGKKPIPDLSLETGRLQDPNCLYISMGRHDTEYDYFEDYFEGIEFTEWMQEAIKDFITKNPELLEVEP